MKKNGTGSCLPVKPAPGCKTDLCTAKKSGRSDLLARLRPEKPAAWARNPRTWLDTNNINDVMRQYERAYPHFKYLATIPVDAFERKKDGTCISQFCDLTAKTLAASGKSVLGMVFNLDRHDQSGSHWVMAAINMRVPSKPEVYYYDSFGKPPPKQIMAFFTKFVDGLPPKARAYARKHSSFNNTKHQRGNTECGIYSVVALEHVLKGGKFSEHCSKKISDDEAFAARDRLYSSSDDQPNKKKGFFESMFS